jgi:hypothetical protein
MVVVTLIGVGTLVVFLKMVTLNSTLVGVELIDVTLHMLGRDITSGDTGSVLLLEQQTSPSKSGVVVVLVLELAVASTVTLVVLVLMLLRLCVLSVTLLLDFLSKVVLSVECAGKCSLLHLTAKVSAVKVTLDVSPM